MDMLHSLLPFILASTMVPLDPARLPAQSSLIVTGCVTSTRVVHTKPTYEELSTIEVAAVLKGTSAKTIRVRTRTGLIFFDRHLKRGESGVFFLTPSEKGTYEAAYPQGFALFEDGATECR